MGLNHRLYYQGVVALCYHVALSILITLQADTRRHESLCAVILQFRTSEVQIGHKRRLLTCRCLGGISLEQVHWQHTLKHGHLVDITLEHAFTRSRAGIGCTQSQVVTHDTTQCINSERLHQILVNVDITHITATRHCHGIVMPAVVINDAVGLDFTVA